MQSLIHALASIAVWTNHRWRRAHMSNYVVSCWCNPKLVLFIPTLRWRQWQHLGNKGGDGTQWLTLFHHHHCSNSSASSLDRPRHFINLKCLYLLLNSVFVLWPVLFQQALGLGKSFYKGWAAHRPNRRRLAKALDRDYELWDTNW